MSSDKRKRLSDHDAILMCRERLTSGTTLADLARKYGVSYGTAQLICGGLSRPSALRTAQQELANENAARQTQENQ